MNYTVVYDSTSTNLRWWVLSSPLFFIALLMLLLVLGGLRLSRRGPFGQKLLLLAILVLISVSVTLDMSYGYFFSRNFYRYYGSYRMIEGVVKNYRVIRSPNSVGEQFDVNGIHFGYLDLFQWKCFHKAAANGGPIHEGLPVRISYAQLHFAPCIVKLEVAEEKH